MKEYYDIAVMGESMAGKSTLISSLFSSNIAAKLSEISYCNEEENKYIQNLLDDRGIYGVDACIFMSVVNSNALLKANNKKIYKPIIQYMLKKCPTFLTIRSDRMTEKLNDEKNCTTYKDVLNDLIQNEQFTGFIALEKLLKELGLFSKSKDYMTQIAHKHYKKLILADIAFRGSDYGDTIDDSIDTQDMQNQVDISSLYLKSVIGAFSEIIENINSYYEDLNKAKQLYKKSAKYTVI